MATQVSSQKRPGPPKSCAKSCADHARPSFSSISGGGFILEKKVPSRHSQGMVRRSSAGMTRCTKSCCRWYMRPLQMSPAKGRSSGGTPCDALSLRPGGVYRTATGAVRGPTPYLYVAALVAKWEAFPQTIVLNDNRSLLYSF